MRSKELTPNKDYADFLAYEFKPWLCDTWSICPNPRDTILSGSSFGGLASMYIAFQHPQQFGKVLSQSGSFWWAPRQTKSTTNWVTDLVLAQEKKPIDIYLNAGRFETEPQSNSILNTNRQLYNALNSKGYTVSFQEVSSGHDYFSWRVMLAEGLVTLFSSNTQR